MKCSESGGLNRSLGRGNKLERHSGSVLLILRGRVEGVFIADSCVAGVLRGESRPRRIVAVDSRVVPLRVRPAHRIREDSFSRIVRLCVLNVAIRLPVFLATEEDRFLPPPRI